jgi:hypothetical protein
VRPYLNFANILASRRRKKARELFGSQWAAEGYYFLLAYDREGQWEHFVNSTIRPKFEKHIKFLKLPVPSNRDNLNPLIRTLLDDCWDYEQESPYSHEIGIFIFTYPRDGKLDYYAPFAAWEHEDEDDEDVSDEDAKKEILKRIRETLKSWEGET